MKGKRYRQKDNKNKIITIIRVILLIVGIICIINIINWFIENRKSKSIIDEINLSITPDGIVNIDNTKVEKQKIDFEKLKNINADIVGWIKVNGTKVEYPIVQSKDNNYYLTHSLDKTYNSAGWIFIDYKNNLDTTDKNIVIYGHNRRDGTMFGSLKNILEEEWYNNKENRYIVFETAKGTEIYEVFSVYQIEVEDYYIKTNFSNNEEFEEFINTVKSRSIKNFENEVTNNDNILTLSTCANNNKYRVVLHAKKYVSSE